MLNSTPILSTDDHAVVVSDIGIHANEYTHDTLHFSLPEDRHIDPGRKRRRVQLEVVDGLYGPLNIGSLAVTRAALDVLGATINGQPLNGQNTFFRIPSRFFVDSLQFNSADVEAQIKSIVDPDDYRLPTLLFEMASQRPSAAASLLMKTLKKPDPGSDQSRLEKLLGCAQRLHIHPVFQDTALSWVNNAKSKVMTHTGLGLQAFGIYSGLRGLQDAINNKDNFNIVFNSVSLSAEVSSIAVEEALVKQAARMLKAAQGAAKDFAKMEIALRLGRGAGLIAGMLTLPIDIFSAITAFKEAAKSTGKQAMDHYVGASLSITSAVMTVGIGAAALAGFSAAGPVGLVAGLTLAVGAQIYGAVRQVDEIDDYIELTTLERLRTGWFAFSLQEPDKDINDRYLIAKATAAHTKKLQAEAEQLLKGPLKDSTEAIVNGTFHVALEDVPFYAAHWLTGEKYLDERQRPKIVDDDDTVDARGGVTVNTPGAILGTSADHKDIQWNIGGGNDTVLGVEKKQNIFRYEDGIKHLSGGEKDDLFIFEGANPLPKETGARPAPGTLDGGPGNDTLILAGRSESHLPSKRGYHVDLTRNQVSIIRADNTEHLQTALKNIENIAIYEGGTHMIKGSEAVNIIKSQGYSTIEAGGGDDSIFLMGANNLEADGGSGNDSYVIVHQPGRIILNEDGLDSSIVFLNWRADLIESWNIAKNDLIITSRFDSNDMDCRQVIIKNAYKTTDNGRHINNRKLTFMTRDDYQLTPDLPETLDADTVYKASIAITKQGTLRNPFILRNGVTQKIPHNKDSNYYCSRLIGESTLEVTKLSTFTTTLHLDYSSKELMRIEAHYKIHLESADAEGIENVKYGKCGLTLCLGVKRIHLINLASSDERWNAQATKRRLFSRLRLQHIVILIMNDGNSYRLDLASPAPGLFLDSKIAKDNPLNWTTELSLPLPRTKHPYAYLPSRDKEPFHMGARATCAQLIPPPELTGIEVLIGEGSTYLVHLKPDMVLRLSTPGAMAGANPRLPHSSTWDLDATQLGHVEITLLSNLLKIGSVLVHLPKYADEDLVDQVRVIMATGVVHAVDIRYEDVYVDAIDARYFSPPKLASEALPEALSTLAEVRVLNIATRDGAAGQVNYDLKKRKWFLGTDRLRLLEASELKKVNLCDHLITRYQDYVRYGLDENVPLTTDIMQTIRKVFVELSESINPTEIDDIKISTALRHAFGTTPFQSGLYYGQNFDPVFLNFQPAFKP